MLNFIRLLQGYVCIRINGYSPERFLNLCRINGILLWDIIPCNHDYVLKMNRKDFKKIKPFAKKTGVKAVITKKCGLPFFMHKNRKRKLFFFGIPFCIAFLYILTGFVWSFEFVGNSQITDDMIRCFLKDEQIKTGTEIKKIKIEELEREIRENFDCITWTSVKIKGTCLVIEIKENDLPEIEKATGKSNGMNITAISDGTIVNMITRRGIPQKKQGETVKKGEVLVEGCVPIFDNDGNIISFDYCEADADIYLQMYYPIHKSISRYYQYKNYTGRSVKKRYLKAGNHYLAFNIKKITYPKYDIIEEEKQISILGKLELPFWAGKKTYREYVEIDAMYSDDAAISLLKEFLNNSIEELNEKGVQIIENNVKIDKNSESIELNGNFLIRIRNEQKQPTQQKELPHREDGDS
ncbi:MAG: sporulation protein YqfD [Lachnospiraceae bacterium]|nr:sporulation protein YqfD [Lachnospiraceae bacterium]